MIFLYKLIKHRGKYTSTIKENTYMAIKDALLDNNYVGVEFDVRETKDHEFVIYHDALWNGMLISNLNLKDLPRFIPTLKMVLNIKSDKIFLIELKNISSFPKFIKLLTKYQNKNIYVMSFSNSLIDKINVENKTYKVGILNYVLNTNKEKKPLQFVAILNSLLTKKMVDTLSNLEIFSYGLFENKRFSNVFYIVD